MPKKKDKRFGKTSKRTERVDIRLEPQLTEMIDHVVSKTGMSGRSSMIRQLLKDYHAFLFQQHDNLILLNRRYLREIKDIEELMRDNETTSEE